MVNTPFNAKNVMRFYYLICTFTLFFWLFEVVLIPVQKKYNLKTKIMPDVTFIFSRNISDNYWQALANSLYTRKITYLGIYLCISQIKQCFVGHIECSFIVNFECFKLI